MRVRKVVNLYSDEPAHAEILEYLEYIEGDTRRQQALVQMLVIGFRVMDKHESGEEALFRSRNPDMSRIMDARSSDLISGITPLKKARKEKRPRVIEHSSPIPATKHPAERQSDPTPKVSESTNTSSISEIATYPESGSISTGDHDVSQVTHVEVMTSIEPKDNYNNEATDSLALLKAMSEGS